jgi:hypothetical protein
MQHAIAAIKISLAGIGTAMLLGTMRGVIILGSTMQNIELAHEMK